MRNFPFGYREVIPDQTLPEKWKEFTLNMGGTQFTLQETKVPDSSGGYSYKDSSDRFTRNRFIYWRIQRNELELVEHSLDLHLVGNCVRYKFQNTLLLEGVSVHEVLRDGASSVVILVTTVSSVHRFSFPHPLASHRQYTSSDHADTNAQSIFADASFAAARDPSTFFVINNTLSNVNLPHASTSYLTDGGNALFALAYKTGLVMLIRMSESGETSVQELKESRGFLFGLADAFKGSKQEDVVPVSMALHCIDSEVYLFSLCCGGSLRITPCYDKSKSIIVFNVSSLGDEYHKCVDIRGVRRHVLRKAVGSANNRLYLGAFLYGRSTSVFCMLKPVIHENGKMTVTLLGRRFHDPKDHILIDFCCTRSRLWALWHTQDEVPVLMNNLLDRDHLEWEQVVLEQPPERESVAVDPREHPQQAYISYIFQPGLFPLSIIARALSVYQKSPMRGDMLAVSSRELEASVCHAMEETVQDKVSNQDLTDDEKLRVAHACWAQFCSSCISFYGKASKVVGLMVAEPADGIVLLKQCHFSLVRPMDTLEHLLLMRLDTCQLEHFHLKPLLGDDPVTCTDLIKLMLVVQSLEREAPGVSSLFQQELDNLKTPMQIVEEIFLSGLVGRVPMGVLDSLENLVASTDVAAAMRLLVGVLACDFGEPRRDGSEDNVADFFHSLPKLYSSRLGASTIAQSLYQVAVARLTICRSILLCQQLMLTNNRIGLALSSSAVATLATLYQQTGKLTQQYHALAWVCCQTAVPSSLDEVVAGHKNLLLTKQLSSSPRRLTVVELFFQLSQASSYSEALGQLDRTEDVFLWQNSMLSYVTTLGGLLWPTEYAHSFLHFLMSAAQQTVLEQYDHLLEWLDINDHVCKFLLGCCYLASGEENKALHVFEWAVDGAADEFFSHTLQLDVSNYSSRNHLLVAYYTKVISMFELRNHHECIIRLAVCGIANMPDNHGLATLKSVLFNQYLRLHRFREAYEAMCTNPDPLQQDSHLRQLVLRLFDQQRLDLLLEFSTQGIQEIQDKVESIVRYRAQTMSVRANLFYKFLLVFYLEHGNMRKAASIMYEQGLRLGLEMPGDRESLQQQSNCYVACLSLLREGEPKYAWIVKPVLENNVSPGQRVGQLTEGAALSLESTRRVVEVLELWQIEREYELVSAHMKLLRYSPQRGSKGNQKNASELVAELTGERLYNVALRLCQVFGMSAEPVVEGLATDCVSAGSCDEASTWEWLSRNDVADLRVAGRSAQDVAWRLLQQVLEGTELAGASLLHRAVMRRLCLLAAFLPEWLVAGYKLRAPAELLRSLLEVGRLADAARLAEEYVWAVLGHGKEHFGLESALVASSPQVYVPTHTIDLLLRELLDAGKDEEIYTQIHNSLQQLMAYYLETVMRVSQDKLRAAATK